VLVQFGGVIPFLEKHDWIAPTRRRKLVFKSYDQIQILQPGIDNTHYPNVNALAQRLSTRGRSSQQWKQYASKCVQPGLDYFKSKISGDSSQLKDTLDDFKAARLLYTA